MDTDSSVSAIKRQLLLDIDKKEKLLQSLVESTAKLEADVMRLEESIKIYQKMLEFFNQK